jgi:hypothetical protein
MLMALAYEKPTEVVQKFILLRKKIADKFNNDAVKKFLEYFDKTYIGTFCVSLFKIKNWSTNFRILNDIDNNNKFCRSLEQTFELRCY